MTVTVNSPLNPDKHTLHLASAFLQIPLTFLPKNGRSVKTKHTYQHMNIMNIKYTMDLMITTMFSGAAVEQTTMGLLKRAFGVLYYYTTAVS